LGLATDYCVKSTVLDALAQGLRVTVIVDAVAGVDVQPGDSAQAMEQMKQAGVVSVIQIVCLSLHLSQTVALSR
jgi:nicotinamidase/pyrazinamidase